MKRLIGLLAAVLCAVFSFSGCGGIGGARSAESTAAEVTVVQDWNKTVAVFLAAKENESAEELAAIEEAFEGSGWGIAVETLGDDDETYNAAFEEAVENKAAGIICDNMRTNDITEAVRKAFKANIPVVLLEKGITEDGLCLAQIQTDTEKGVKELAAKFAGRLGGNARYMSISQDNNSWSTDMISAFQVGMLGYDGMYEVTSRSVNGYNMSDAESEIREVFLVSPSIEAAVCANSRVTEAMILAMESMGRTDVVVVCADGDGDGMRALVEEGKIYGAVARPAAKLGTEGSGVLLSFLKNGTVPEQERMKADGVLYVREDG
ncbi:MAG: substrate-binding domain-containing protein [Lachnospiraceae bacterium]|nr:substrate-binding domain-containing protein [Lachnospiraceae bacterium]